MTDAGPQRGAQPQPEAGPQPGTRPQRGAGLSALETDWRTLDARMLLIHPVTEGIRFLPALVAVFIAGRTSDGHDWWQLAAVAAVVVLGVLRWLTTRYRIGNGQIELRKGLLNKQVIATPADRVRTVDVTAPVFHRLLGVAKVEIGTAGGGHRGERIVLDALGAAEARHLREELLHRRGSQPSELPGEGSTWADDGRSPVAAEAAGPEAETTLLVLQPSWVRFAPLTISGFLSGLAVVGFGGQFVSQGFGLQGLRGAEQRVSDTPLWLALTAGAGTVAVAVSVLAVVGYVLSFWGFRLTRHGGGSLHVSRGLLTTRETSIEEARLRGLEVGEPLGLRLAGGGRLQAVTTGLSRRENERGSAWLVPPAPRAVVERVAAEVVGDPEALSAPLTSHGHAARRRRYVRAVGPALLVSGAAVALTLLRGWPGWVLALAGLTVLASPALAKDRYAGLGHHLTARHLVVSSGSFSRRRDALSRDGIIGWNVRQTLFQRRSGLVTLTATTAAGRQGYHLHDVEQSRAVQVGAEVTPALVAQFLAR